MPFTAFEIVKITTSGDLITDRPLKEIGGKGLFTKEIEHELLLGTIDIAVHSMKDLPMDILDEFQLIAITEREDPRDAFISNNFNSLEEMPKGAIIGTSSLRRQSQIKANFPDLIVKPLRGNLQTRLNKLDQNQYGAIILAAAGLIRLGLKNRIKKFLDSNISIPAVGQGALGIEVLKGNKKLNTILSALNDEDSSRCVLAERLVSRLLAGSCTVPLGAFATISKNNFIIKGFVAKPDGSKIIHAEKSGNKSDFYKLGEDLGKILIDKGAKDILSNI